MISSRAEFRAGGTDLSERRRSGVSRGRCPRHRRPGRASFTGRRWRPAAIGALDEGRRSPLIPDPGARLSGSVGERGRPGDAADPARRDAGRQHRAAQSLLVFPQAEIACLKKGGDNCPARSGNALYGVAFDCGPCVAPHPSTLAAALLAYDARIVTNRRSGLSVGELLGDGSNGRADHALGPSEMIKQIVLGIPLSGERAVYKRAISRTHAEWPLVELCARAVVADGVFKFVRLGAGGIAPVPLRLQAAEAALEGKRADAATIAEAVRQSTAGAKPLPMTGYKLDLLSGLVRDLLEQLAA